MASNACDSVTGTVVPDSTAKRIDDRSTPSNRRCCIQAAMWAGPPISTVGFICTRAAMKSGGVNIGTRHAVAPTEKPSSRA
jgi:hypothetical protein